MAELSMTLVQMEGLKYWIDDILNVTTYDEHADLRWQHRIPFPTGSGDQHPS